MVGDQTILSVLSVRQKKKNKINCTTQFVLGAKTNQGSIFWLFLNAVLPPTY
jgi:hypothetical protein